MLLCSVAISALIIFIEPHDVLFLKHESHFTLLISTIHIFLTTRALNCEIWLILNCIFLSVSLLSSPALHVLHCSPSVPTLIIEEARFQCSHFSPLFFTLSFTKKWSSNKRQVQQLAWTP